MRRVALLLAAVCLVFDAPAPPTAERQKELCVGDGALVAQARFASERARERRRTLTRAQADAQSPVLIALNERRNSLITSDPRRATLQAEADAEFARIERVLAAEADIVRSRYEVICTQPVRRCDGLCAGV